MKSFTFSRVSIRIQKQSGYNRYQLNATYKGQEIEVVTRNSFIWDWVDDDSDLKKMKEAQKEAYLLIKKHSL